MITIDDIKRMAEYRKLKFPETSDQSLKFAVTELGELFDARIRTYETGWVRNTSDKDVNVGFEYGDVYQMLQIASYLDTGKSMEDNLIEKWQSKGYNYYPNSVKGNG